MNRKSAAAFGILTVLAVAFAVAVGVNGTHTATAQADPYGGLPTEVRAAADAVRSGNLQRILAALPAEGAVVRTAFPGSGGDVSLETARQEIAALVVSDPSRSDSFGNGAYTLIAIWRPSINPGEALLVGSGIGPDGVRKSTAFGVSVVSGRPSFTGYGWILDLSATLAQFGSQGDLRRISATPPSPPATGSSAANAAVSHDFQRLLLFVLVLGVATAAASAFRTSRRQAH